MWEFSELARAIVLDWTQELDTSFFPILSPSKTVHPLTPITHSMPFWVLWKFGFSRHSAWEQDVGTSSLFWRWPSGSRREGTEMETAEEKLPRGCVIQEASGDNGVLTLLGHLQCVGNVFQNRSSENRRLVHWLTVALGMFSTTDPSAPTPSSSGPYAQKAENTKALLSSVAGTTVYRGCAWN